MGSKTSKCLLPRVLLLLLAPGCFPLSHRIPPEPRQDFCPEGAHATFLRLGLAVGRDIPVDIGVGPSHGARLFRVRTGYIEGRSRREVSQLPGGARLQGWLWTDGERVEGHIYQVRLRDGSLLPFCGVLMDGSRRGLEKSRAPYPGAAFVGVDDAQVRVVSDF